MERKRKNLSIFFVYTKILPTFAIAKLKYDIKSSRAMMTPEITSGIIYAILNT